MRWSGVWKTKGKQEVDANNVYTVRKKFFAATSYIIIGDIFRKGPKGLLSTDYFSIVRRYYGLMFRHKHTLTHTVDVFVFSCH